ncbi:MAG: hypothetical protein K5873_00625 [Treponema sp.]|nr:hypothetical protein [Treponema sp.]
MRKQLCNLILPIISGLFLLSCGLQEVFFITEPTVVNNNPLYSSSDPLTWYFSFVTAPSSSNDSLSYTGTDVYYKIYSNYSNLTSQKSSILSVNTDTNGTAAATRMIETYTYQPLGTSTSTDKAVFFEDHNSQSVILRLKNYQNGIASSSADYEELMKTRYQQNACVGYKTSGSTEYTYEDFIPYRNSAVGTKSFDFFDYDEDNKGGARDVIPVEGDADFYYNSTFSEENCYYVQLFAIARAWNSAEVSPVYSLVLDLGSVPIRKGE